MNRAQARFVRYFTAILIDLVVLVVMVLAELMAVRIFNWLGARR